MSHRIAAGLIVLCVSLLAIASLAGPADADPSTSITGTVTSAATGQPLGAGQVVVQYVKGQGGASPGAILSTVPQGLPSVPVQADGTYTIPDVAAGNGYYLYFTFVGPASSGYVGNWYGGSVSYGSTVIYPSAGVTSVADNTMKQYSTVSGEIDLGQAGNPAPAGSAQVSYQGCGFASNAPDAGTVTVGAGGRYTITGFPPGECALHVHSLVNAYQDALVTSGLPNGGPQPSTINAVLTSTHTVSGHVYLGSTTTPAGAGDVKVTLEVLAPSGSFVTVASASSTTDASGAYALPFLADGYYRETFVYLRGTAYVGVTLGAAFNVYGDVTQNGTIAAAIAVSGHVSLGAASTSARLNQVAVTVTRVDRFGQDPVGTVQPTYSGATDAAGNYVIGGIPPGSYYSVTFAYRDPIGDFTTATTDAQLWATSVTGFDRTLAPGNEITGTVTSVADPAHAAAVTVNASTYDPATGDTTLVKSTRTRADGSYEIKDMPLGSYEVDFVPDDPAYATEEYDSQSIYYEPTLVSVTGGAVGGIDGEVEPGATITGHIGGPGLSSSDITNGYVGIDIEVFDESSDTWVDTGDGEGYPSDAGGGIAADGTFTIRALYPDSYRLLAFYDGPRGTVEKESPTIEADPGAAVTQDLQLPVILSLAAGPPIGSLDSAFEVPDGNSTTGDVVVGGWAIDPKTTRSITVHVYADGRFVGAATAGASRPDIGAAFSGYGAAHGFSLDVPSLSAGSHSLCVYGINTDATKANSLLGCRSATVLGGPVGSFDSITAGPGYVTVRGWEIDSSTASPATMHLYGQVDTVGQDWDINFLADQLRPDIGAAFPGYGSAHGFVATATGALPGTRVVCLAVTGIAGLSPNMCKTVVVPVANPFGSLDSVTSAGPGAVQVSGWAIDADATTATTVQFYVDGRGSVAVPAGSARADLAGAFPGLGTAHGYTATISGLAAGSHAVCGYAINQGMGGNALLGCRTITVLGGMPLGSFDAASITGIGTVSVVGWAFDPDSTSSIPVTVTVDGGAGTTITASNKRDDIAAAFPGYGAAHGFGTTIAGLAGGAHTICIVAANTGPGSDSSIGCKRVIVPTGSPRGSLDTAAAGPASIVIAGWALDPDVSASIPVAVYVDGGHFVTQVTASATRLDIAAAFPGYGSAHGYSATATGLSAGPHTICAYGINQGPTAGNSVLGCATVTVRSGPPFGSFDAVAPGSAPGTAVVSGWAIDPDLSGPVTIGVNPNATPTSQTFVAGTTRPDIGAAFPGYGADHGFSAIVTGLHGGTNRLCVSVADASGGPAVDLGCRTVSVITSAV